MGALNIDGFFDIETAAWDQFVLGGALDADNQFILSDMPWMAGSDTRFYRALRSVGGTIWSWNGGLFDSLWALDMARRSGDKAKVSAAGTRVTRVEFGGRTVLRDAVALIPMSLKQAAGIADIELNKDTGLPCSNSCRAERETTDSCGGYCAISRDMPMRHWRLLAQYLEHDVRTGMAVLRRVNQLADEYLFSLRGTVGGSSYATMAQQCAVEPATWTWRQYKRARSAYFGGRCQVLRPACGSGYRYDIHSAYPAALSATPLPCGDRGEVSGAKARRAFARGKEGVYTAVATIGRDTFLPPLPWRLGSNRKGRGGRVCYPVGTVRGTWTRLELEYAIELGHHVEIVSGLIWSDAEAFLAPFVDHVWKCRAAAGTDTPTGKWLKWFANSATGKLAESPHKQQIYLFPDHDKIRACGGADDSRGGVNHMGPWGCTDDKCSGTCSRWTMLDRQGDLWSQPVFRIPDNGHVHLAAYLTAATRIEWHRMATADGVGGRTAVYGDTDSVFATSTRSYRIGNDLGQWGDDGEYDDFIALAPKCYNYRDRATGRERTRAKGLSGISADDFRRFLAGETIHRDRGVMGLRSAAARGQSLFVRKMVARSNQADGLHFGDRVLRDDGLTYPQTTKELLAWRKKAR